MTYKTMIFLALISTVQLISSCCSQSSTFEVLVQEVTIEVLGAATTTHSKESFELLILFLVESEEVSSLMHPSIGFNSAYANANPFNTCGDSYIALHTISEYKLYVEDVMTQEIQLANSAFGLNEKETIEDVMSSAGSQSSLYGDKSFRLIDSNAIPQSSRFIVEVTMESGEVFSAQTSVINFE